MVTTLSDAVVERWRLQREKAEADAQWVAENQRLDARRHVIQREIQQFADQFLAGKVDAELFRETFDRKTRHEWDGFGFRGMSGAMFLNMLVKHVPDQSALEREIKGILNAPSDTEDGRRRFRGFLEFLEKLTSSGLVTKRQIQPARVSFFVPLWWHLRDTEQWPIFYPLSRKALELDGLYSSTSDPERDYFAFRDCFLSLASALGMKSWDLEHLCVWLDRKHSVALTTATPEQRIDEGDEEEEERTAEKGATVTHTQVQWLLAKLGSSLGCRVWIATNDRNKEWNGEKLGDLSMTALPPLGIDQESQRLVERIDVLWLKGGKQVAAAFEIEHTTSIYSGLLRMSDLIALAPNLNFPLYIVTSTDRLDQVRRQLLRPTFQALELHKRCAFFSDDALIREGDGIMRWANDPSAIERLGIKVDDTAASASPYRAEPAAIDSPATAIDDPVMLIRINKLYRPDMSPNDLYDATRRAWKVGTRREKARLACAVFEGVVREVYEIGQWRRASPREGETWKGDRWEFVGKIADESVRSKYLGRPVNSYFTQGAQNPITYVNC